MMGDGDESRAGDDVSHDAERHSLLHNESEAELPQLSLSSQATMVRTSDTVQLWFIVGVVVVHDAGPFSV
jgi:hypothetical protein